MKPEGRSSVLTYSDVPTPLADADPETDRCVKFRGETIARVRRISQGSKLDVWAFSRLWREPGGNGVGHANGLNAALAEVQRLHIEAGQPLAVEQAISKRRSSQ